MKNTKMNSADESSMGFSGSQNFEQTWKHDQDRHETNDEPLSRFQCILEEAGAWLLLSTGIGFLIHL